MPLLSIRLAVLTVSPKKQNRGILIPTTPVVAGPVWMPTRMFMGSPLCGARTSFAPACMAKAISQIAVACCSLSPTIPGRGVLREIQQSPWVSREIRTASAYLLGRGVLAGKPNLAPLECWRESQIWRQCAGIRLLVGVFAVDLCKSSPPAII